MDSDGDGDEYEPTDSEAEYNEEEREIMEDLRKERKKREERQKESQEILAFSDSDDEDEDEDDVGELMHDSDIEGAEIDDGGLPDTMNWGTKKSSYYNTDFVDPDYSSYTAQQEELAQIEEEEAKKIQLRLVKQMNEVDFELDVPETIENRAENEEGGTIKVASDLSSFNVRDLEQLHQKDSPEFAGLTHDFRRYIKEILELTGPILKYVNNNNVPIVPALKFAFIYHNVLLSFCNNYSYYLLLKANRRDVKHSPVIKRLLQFKQLHKQLLPRYVEYIQPQLEALLERIQDGDEFKVLDVKERKAKLKILNQYEERPSKISESDKLRNGTNDDETDESEQSEGEEADQQEDEDSRRGITYQIAKNKGLTPHRKKELRNPRVKHRGKYRKALIRRKGAVRTVRKELGRYGGEISGIKSTVTKSVKFKS